MPSQLNLWANQLDPIIPQSLRTSNWKLLIHHAPQTTMRHDVEVKKAIDDWVYRRLLPMVTPVATFSDEGDEWREMIERRVLRMHRFKNRTLNKVLASLDAKPFPDYATATKLALREIYCLRRTWRGYDQAWVKDLDVPATLGLLTSIAEHGGYAPTPQD